MDNQKEAYAQIETNLKKIDELLKECVDLAEKNSVEFTLHTPRTSLDYVPVSLNKPDEWNASDTISGWMSSSDYC